VVKLVGRRRGGEKEGQMRRGSRVRMEGDEERAEEVERAKSFYSSYRAG
jgi:hypothetical protein